MTTTRHFELKDDKSAKFWEITQTSNTVTVRYGKTGTNGQTLEKAFADAAAAGKHAAKLIAEKLGKGYIEQGNAPVIGADAPAAPEVPVEKALKPGAESETKKLPVKAAKAQPVKSAKPKNPAQDPEATPESLMALLNKDDATNRLLAKNPRASADLLEKLSHSSDQATRRAVAGNPNTPPQIYVRLGQQFPKEFLSNSMLDLLLMENPALVEEVPEALLIRLLKHADCPQSLLAWAAGYDYEKVQLAVAMNANAPARALEKLRASRHSAVLETVNAMSGAEYEQDTEHAFEQAVRARLGSLDISDLRSAWEEGDIGLSQWTALPLSFRLFKAIERNINGLVWRDRVLPVSVLDALAKDKDRELRKWVAENPSAPVPALEALAKEKGLAFRKRVAGNPSAPVLVLEALAKDSEWWIREGVAANPSAPVPVLETLANDIYVAVRKGVAANPSTSVPVLAALAKEKDMVVRKGVAENPSAPVPVLEALARDEDEAVRKGVAGNPSSPAHVLAALAKDKDKEVRGGVAENPSSPAHVLEALAKDSERWVSDGVAGNPSAPVHVLETMAKDKEVRMYVAYNPATSVSVLEALAKDKDKEVRKGVAENPSAPAHVLEALAKDKDMWIRKGIAGNPSAPVHVLDSLAKDKDKQVREGVAENPSTSAPVLAALAKDKDEAVREKVAINQKLTPEMLDKMFQGTEDIQDLTALLVHPNLGTRSAEQIAEKIARSWYQSELLLTDDEEIEAAQAGSVLSYFGYYPNTAVLSRRVVAPLMALCAGPDVVEPGRIVKVADSTDWLIRAAVARNPGTPPNLLKKLTADTHPLVALLARRTQEASAKS